MSIANLFSYWSKLFLETPKPIRQKYARLFVRTFGLILVFLGLLSTIWYLLAPWASVNGITAFGAALICAVSWLLLKRNKLNWATALLYISIVGGVSLAFWQTAYFVDYFYFSVICFIGIILYGRIVASIVLALFTVQSWLYAIVFNFGLTAPDGQKVVIDPLTLILWWIIIAIGFWLVSLIYSDLMKDNLRVRQNQEILTLAQQLGNIGNYTYNLSTKKVIWSDQMYRINGLEPGQIALSLESGLKYIHPDDLGLLFQKSTEATTVGHSELEIRTITHNKELRYVLVKLSLIFNSEGKPESLLGTVLDITERKQADLKIQEQAFRAHSLATLSQLLAEVGPDYTKLLDTITEQISLVIGDGCSIQLISADNQWLETAAIYHPNSKVVAAYLNMLKETPLRVDSGNVGQVFQTGQPLLQPELSLEQVLATIPPEHRQEAEKFRIYSRIIVPLKAQGHIIGVLGVSRYQPDKPYTLDDQIFLQDLSDRAALAIVNARLYNALEQELNERKLIQTERETLIEALETKNAELERFTYTVSHDLKSPLITIRGFLGYLEKDALSGNTTRLKTDIGRISDATVKMQRLLDELLELSRIGRIIRPPESVPFEEIVNEALAIVEGQRNNNHAQVEVAQGLPNVCGDRTRLVEVLQNLLDNAIKFKGEQPEAFIQIGQQGYNIKNQPVFFVKDNGIGIDPRFQDKVFGLFDKLDPHSEGTGVGLALVKRIIEVHGGNIWLESEGLGKGTAFYFTLNTPDQSYKESSNDDN